VTLLEAIASRNRDALTQLLADDVVFHSPVQTYRGREQVVHLLATIGTVIDDIEPRRVLDGVTFFVARVEEHPVDGVFDERTKADGRISEITLMMRPLATLQAAVARITRTLAQP
jgi:SnoaL-like domain